MDNLRSLTTIWYRNQVEGNQKIQMKFKILLFRLISTSRTLVVPLILQMFLLLALRIKEVQF